MSSLSKANSAIISPLKRAWGFADGLKPFLKWSLIILATLSFVLVWFVAISFYLFLQIWWWVFLLGIASFGGKGYSDEK